MKTIRINRSKLCSNNVFDSEEKSCPIGWVYRKIAKRKPRCNNDLKIYGYKIDGKELREFEYGFFDGNFRKGDKTTAEEYAKKEFKKIFDLNLEFFGRYS